MFRRTFDRLRQIIKKTMASALETKGVEKRSAEDVGGDICKKQKLNESRDDRKRKVALLIAYNGKGYYGLQVNPGFPTIESEILKALLAVGVIPQHHHDVPQKMSFQRAARTDKGVSAAGNIMLLNVENLLDKVNENLPPQIRVFDCIRTTNSFNSKNHCSGRTYIYLIPTIAFSPVEQTTTLEYRAPLDVIERVNEVVEKFIGSHNFHNFTSGIKPTEGCAKRYIKSFECRLPFVYNGVEFCVLSVTGQSFMMHQIRKMVGLTIAIVRGFADMRAIDEAWKHEKMDIPKAPGLGLMLDKLHYDVYNRRHASDGSHAKIDFKHLREELDKFKQEFIFTEIMKEEIETQSMMDWMSKLHYHSYSTESNSWALRKVINEVTNNASEKTENQSEKPEEQTDGISQEKTDTACAENTDATSLENTDKVCPENYDSLTKIEEQSETGSKLSAVANKDIVGVITDTNSANQNDCNKAVMSQVDCDSKNEEARTENETKDEDQSENTNELRVGSSSF